MAIISLPGTLFLAPPRSSISASPSRVSSSTSSLPRSSSSSDRHRRLAMRGPAGTGMRSVSTAATAAPASGYDQNTLDALGNISVFSAATGEPVLLQDLWDQTEGMAVVALLRHFGCPCCWELASVLRDSMSRFDSAGVKLIAIGVGSPDKARILAERLPFPLDSLYADPEHKAYDILGLYYGLGRTFFNPASAKVFSRFESLQKAVKNYTISATPDDGGSVLQQGGMFIFKGKKLLYARKDEGTGDHAPLDDILDICCTAPVA